MRKASGEMRNLLLRCGSFLKRNHTATSFFSGPGDAAPSLRPAMASTSLGFLLVLCTCGLCEDRVITLDGDVENFVVGSNKVFVLSDSRLHQLTLDLALEKSRSVSNETFTNTVNILVPFESNKTLVVCGSWSIGYCEVLDISDISTLLYWESIPAGVSPGVSLVVEIGNGKYLLVGRSKVAKEHSSDALSVSLRNTLHTQKGDIFSSLGPNMTPGIESVSDGDFDFVDGFQLEPRGSIYLFLNIKGRVQMLLLHSKNGKAETFRSLQGAVLECYKNQNQSLVSSAFIPGGSVVRWAGIFSPCNSSGDTVLAVFNIDGSQAGAVSDVCINGQPCKKSTTDKTLTPEAVVFTYRDMTSVAAMRTNNWIFLFIGTGNGQLLKLPLNGSLTPGCPVVLSDGDQKVFPRMLFDPAIQTHIYIAMGNQIRRVPVANCGIHIKLRDCWYAADPSCGWCLSQHRCTFHDQCNSSDWISGYGTQMISVQMVKDPSEQNITVKVVPNLSETLNVSCILEGCGARTPKQCSCILSPNSEDFSITASITIKKEKITEMLLLKNCTSIKESCSQCLSAGCIWSVGKCDWKSPSSNPQMTQVNRRNNLFTFIREAFQCVHFIYLSPQQDNCTKYASEQNHTKPENLTLKPEEVSIHGRNDAWITGRNLNSVTMVRFKGNLYCSPIESPVTWKDPSGKKIKFHIPSGNKGSVTVCVVTHDGQCHGNATLTYMSQPACRRLKPNISWSSGKRKIFLEGNNLHFMESLSQDNITMIKPNITPKGVFFLTPRVENPGKEKATSVEFRVGNHTVACEESIAYVPDPEFTGFNTAQVGKSMQVTIQVKRNKLNLKESEVRILAIAGEVQEECDSVEIKDSTDRTSVLCSIKDPGIKIDSLEITVGGLTRELKANHNWLVMLIPVVAVFILIGPLVVCLYCKKQKKMAEEMKKHLEEIECGIRNEIRQGFVDMQTEKTELIANVGAIPFLDYKHFASRIFFPEAGPLTGLVIKEIGEESEKEQQDKSCQALSQLIREKHFLTLFIHTLEEQKSFSVKDKCTVASLLTLALHDDLPYLTEVMEELLRSLMDQPSNSQPKLLLRRTESIVEKLLTNWMSVCLYGFLRESVGQPLYLLVSALMQQISKGPVDSVTGKALYTLNEDWLLWQAQDFAPLVSRPLTIITDYITVFLTVDLTEIKISIQMFNK
uniref:Sema domain-containing protein n=1 Tax=Denticeps clupeoides TaxID=299321 RepID=A0AAY4EP17_9TELE